MIDTWTTGEYVPLNFEQMRIIKKYRPHECEEGYLVNDTEAPENYMRELSTLREIEAKGGLKVLLDDQGLPKEFVLSSSVRKFEVETLIHGGILLLGKLFNLITGAAGGLIVWLLTQAFSA